MNQGDRHNQDKDPCNGVYLVIIPEIFQLPFIGHIPGFVLLLSDFVNDAAVLPGLFFSFGHS